MSQLLLVKSPLNSHSLKGLENWLIQLGAERSSKIPCLWNLTRSEWSAEILMKQDELKVTWDRDGEISHCSFSYGLTCEDIERAIAEGP